MHVLDVNGDGLHDIVTSMAHNDGVFWLEQVAGGGWVKHVIDESWSQAHAVTLGGSERPRAAGHRHRQATMKSGVNTIIWWAEFGPAHYPLLARLREHGFDGAEIPHIHPDQVRPAEFRRELSLAGLEGTFCSVLPKDLSAISGDKHVRAATREHLKKCIEVAAETGGTIIRGLPYSPVGQFSGERRTPGEWSRAVDLFQSRGEV